MEKSASKGNLQGSNKDHVRITVAAQLTQAGQGGQIRASNFLGQNHGKLKDFYIIGKLIGSGSFGEVRLCLHRETGSQRAVKILKKNKMNEEEK